MYLKISLILNYNQKQKNCIYYISQWYNYIFNYLYLILKIQEGWKAETNPGAVLILIVFANAFLLAVKRLTNDFFRPCSFSD